MIQDAAAKCRFCGEWLDPTKRPDWAQPPASASSAPEPTGMGAPAPVVTERDDDLPLDPASTTTDGSVHRPRKRATQVWSAPAWMAREEEAAAAEPPSEPAPDPEPEPEPAKPTIEAAPTPEPTPEAPSPTVVVATPAPAPVEETLDDVAERMKRIKASAAAVREAMQRESDALQTDVLEDEVEAAATLHAGSVEPAKQEAAPELAPEPKPEPPPDVAAMLGDDFDDLDGDDDDDDSLDDDFDAAKDDDDLDDALPSKAALGGFDFGDDDFDDDDDDDFDGDFGDMGASRPLPWKPIAIGVGVALVLGAGLFWDRLFPSQTLEETPAGEEANAADEADAPAADGQVAQGSVAPAPGQGQPVVPEGQPAAVAAPPPADAGVAPTDPNAVPADPNAVPADPNAVPADPNAAPADPNAVPADPNAAPPAPVGTATPLPPDAITILDEARALYLKNGKKRLKEAREKLQGILDAHPNAADALLLMAQVQLELGEFEPSLETATRCSTVAPQLADCWLTLGVLKQEKKDKAAAKEAYERYLALAPSGAYANDARKQLARLK